MPKAYLYRGPNKYKETIEPFAEHLSELRRRLFYCLSIIIVGTIGAYLVQTRIVAVLLRPAGGQHFIYTSPIGGVDFLFRVCIYTAIALSIPVIIYNFLRYIEPVLPHRSSRFIYFGTLCSFLLAAGGIAFGYFVGLPHAMHFLLHQSINAQVQPLLSIQSYLSFVVKYMLGAALIFQLALIIIAINRIKPLTPRGLLKKEKWVVLLAVIVSGLMNPTPKLVDQLIIIGPLLGLYQLSIVLVWLVNRRRFLPSTVVSIEPENIENMVIPADALDEEPQQPTYVKRTLGMEIVRPGTTIRHGRRIISDFTASSA